MTLFFPPRKLVNLCCGGVLVVIVVVLFVFEWEGGGGGMCWCYIRAIGFLKLCFGVWVSLLARGMEDVELVFRGFLLRGFRGVAHVQSQR